MLKSLILFCAVCAEITVQTSSVPRSRNPRLARGHELLTDFDLDVDTISELLTAVPDSLNVAFPNGVTLPYTLLEGIRSLYYHIPPEKDVTVVLPSQKRLPVQSFRQILDNADFKRLKETFRTGNRDVKDVVLENLSTVLRDAQKPLRESECENLLSVGLECAEERTPVPDADFISLTNAFYRSGQPMEAESHRNSSDRGQVDPRHSTDEAVPDNQLGVGVQSLDRIKISKLWADSPLLGSTFSNNADLEESDLTETETSMRDSVKSDEVCTTEVLSTAADSDTSTNTTPESWTQTPSADTTGVNTEFSCTPACTEDVSECSSTTLVNRNEDPTTENRSDWQIVPALGFNGSSPIPLDHTNSSFHTDSTNSEGSELSSATDRGILENDAALESNSEPRTDAPQEVVEQQSPFLGKHRLESQHLPYEATVPTVSSFPDDYQKLKVQNDEQESAVPVVSPFLSRQKPQLQNGNSHPCSLYYMKQNSSENEISLTETGFLMIPVAYICNKTGRSQTSANSRSQAFLQLQGAEFQNPAVVADDMVRVNKNMNADRIHKEGTLNEGMVSSILSSNHITTSRQQNYLKEKRNSWTSSPTNVPCYKLLLTHSPVVEICARASGNHQPGPPYSNQLAKKSTERAATLATDGTTMNSRGGFDEIRRWGRSGGFSELASHGSRLSGDSLRNAHHSFGGARIPEWRGKRPVGRNLSPWRQNLNSADVAGADHLFQIAEFENLRRDVNPKTFNLPWSKPRNG